MNEFELGIIIIQREIEGRILAKTFYLNDQKQNTLDEEIKSLEKILLNLKTKEA